MLTFFDGDIGIGRSGVGLPVLATPADALAMMDRYGIAKALVYDRGAVESGVLNGFDFIIDFCAGSERLYPTISITPPATREMPPPDELIDNILTNGIKGVRVWPRYHAFDFLPYSFGPLLALLEAHRVPVFYHSNDVQDHPWLHRVAWEHIRETAHAFPHLPIIVNWIGMLDNRRVFPVLETCPNVRTDLNGMTFQYIEFVVEHFGSDRLVLCSHHPILDPGAFAAWIAYSGVSPADRAAIAHRNLAQLVEGIR